MVARESGGAGSVSFPRASMGNRLKKQEKGMKKTIGISGKIYFNPPDSCIIKCRIRVQAQWKWR